MEARPGHNFITIQFAKPTKQTAVLCAALALALTVLALLALFPISILTFVVYAQIS